jgi:hypothetical protein
MSLLCNVVTSLRGKATRMSRSAEVTSLLSLANTDVEAALKQADALSTLTQNLFADKIARCEGEAKLAVAVNADTVARTELASKSKTLEEDIVYRYHRCIQQASQSIADVYAINEQLMFADGIPSTDIRSLHIDEIAKAVDAWPAVHSAARQFLKGAHKETEAFSAEGADFTDVSRLSTLVESTEKVFDRVSHVVIRERARRRDQDKSVSYFLANQTKIMQWCRQQMATLHSLKEDAHIEEFCASFYNNISMMESNFLVMISMSEAVSLPNPEVERAILDVNEQWVQLCTFAFEKLRLTTMDQHAASNLEQKCRQWPEFARRLKPFLADAEKLLLLPTDEQSVAVAAPLRESCRQLQADLNSHLLIVEHLSDFTLRQECLKDHYNAMRKTVFSRLTLKTLALQGQFAYSRKQEYLDRLAELNDWVDCKVQSDAWISLLGRVEQMKRLIEETDLVQQAVSDDRR